MSCPFLKEEVARYCKAYPVKKMIPVNIHTYSRCFGGYQQCLVFREMAGEMEGKAGRKECIWMEQGVVSYRLCVNDYDCESCKFNQMLIDGMALLPKRERCPFLDEEVVRYCKAYPIKKAIPLSSIRTPSPCSGRYQECSVYQDMTKPAENGNKHCVWMRKRLVSYRLCTKNFNCKNCEFDQMVLDSNGKYEESAEIIEAVKKFR